MQRTIKFRHNFPFTLPAKMTLSILVVVLLTSSSFPCSSHFLSRNLEESESESDGAMLYSGNSQNTLIDTNKDISNNNNELLMCLTNYEVSEMSIIRTKDSQKLGAKNLNYTELGFKGKEECLKLCCLTEKCNVAVFEEKNSGTCYLFDCGTMMDFRCKFSTQSYYMSAILRKRDFIPHPQHHNIEMELQKSSVSSHSNSVHNSGNTNNNQHEQELNQLRENGADQVAGKTGLTTMIPLQVAPNGGDQTFDNQNRHGCSRWEFECKSTHECIAIYNVCDGIPQCQDGSDENSAELRCPSSTTNNNADGNKKLPVVPLPAAGGNPPVHSASSSHSVSQQEYDFRAQAPAVQQSDSNKVQEGNHNIFNHKNNGVLDNNPNQVPQFQQQQQFQQPFQQQRHNNNPYWKNGYDYNIPGLGVGDTSAVNNALNSYQQIFNGRNFPIGQYDINNQPYPQQTQIISAVSNSAQGIPQQSLPYGNNGNILMNNGMLSNQMQTNNGYYVNTNQAMNPGVNRWTNSGSGLQQPGQVNVATNVVTTIPPVAVNPDVKSAVDKVTTAPSAAVAVVGSSIITSAPKGGPSDAILQNLLKMNNLQQPQPEISIQKNDDSTELPGNPGAGAVIAFIIGLSMSIVMVVLITCRLRKSGRKSRRRAKNRLDPDYLVDGMYL